MTTYSTIGPQSGQAPPTVKVDVTPIDIEPIVAKLSSIEQLMAYADARPPRFHVPVPVVTIEQAPQDAPVIEVHVPEPVINITVPEVVVEPPAVTVAAPHVEVNVLMPSLRPLLIANMIVLVLLLLNVVMAMAISCHVFW